jgi:hypothetical protein
MQTTLVREKRAALDARDAARVQAEIERHGCKAVAEALGVSRQSAASAAAGLTLRAGIAARIRTRLAETSP